MLWNSSLIFSLKRYRNIRQSNSVINRHIKGTQIIKTSIKIYIQLRKSFKSNRRAVRDICKYISVNILYVCSRNCVQSKSENELVTASGVLF